MCPETGSRTFINDNYITLLIEEEKMKKKSEPNIVPLCDILLVLLIIFMVITPLASKGVDIKIPETGKNGPAIIITIEKNGVIKINKEKFRSFEAFEKRLIDIYRHRIEKKIFIKAHEQVLYKNIIKVIDIVKGVGIDIISVIPQRYK